MSQGGNPLLNSVWNCEGACSNDPPVDDECLDEEEIDNIDEMTASLLNL